MPCCRARPGCVCGFARRSSPCPVAAPLLPLPLPRSPLPPPARRTLRARGCRWTSASLWSGCRRRTARRGARWWTAVSGGRVIGAGPEAAPHGSACAQRAQRGPARRRAAPPACPCPPPPADAPFCKHIFVPNFTGAPVSALPITDANRHLLQSGGRVDLQWPRPGAACCARALQASAGRRKAAAAALARPLHPPPTPTCPPAHACPPRAQPTRGDAPRSWRSSRAGSPRARCSRARPSGWT